MNFGWLTPQSSDDEVRRIVLHEFGHMIGLGHEHQRHNMAWNKPAVISDLSGPPNFWDPATVDNNIFRPNRENLLYATPVDSTSIMMCPIPRSWTLDGDSVGLNNELSREDEGLVRALYPLKEQGVDYPVWFGTNREPAPDGGFTGKRHDQVTRGRVMVHVPRAHRFGETGSGFWKGLWRGDDRLRVKEIVTQAQDAFYASVRETISAARNAGDAPQALIFLHGYNVTFEEAAIRAAQIGYDLKVPGATAFYSWPSRGNSAAYSVDEASVEASERSIADFLLEFAQNCGTEMVNVVAHSMGNRGLLRALQRIAADAATRGKIRFNQIILAAPDVDRDLFLSLSHLYAAHAKRATLYASDRDLAVHLSARLHDSPRASYYTPYTVTAGVDTVAVPNFNIDLLGHSYFAQAEALLHDLYELMRQNQPPGKRQRIDPMQANGLDFWTLRR
jgi:esterase/lipase superfamily enzyme